MLTLHAILVTAALVGGSALAAEDQDPNRFNEFDWRLTKRIDGATEGNVVLSPLSVKAALWTLLEGAAGNSSRQIEAALNFKDSTQSFAKIKFSSIIRSLLIPGVDYDLDIGTKVYVDERVEPKAEFSKRVSFLYNASLERVDFKGGAAAAAAAINAWVSTTTHGHITDLVSPSESLERTELMVVNAIYFNGKWEKPFQGKETAEGEFFTSATSSVTAQFMKEVNTFKFYRSQEIAADVLRLPYSGGKYAMYVVLPHKRDGLREVIGSVDPGKLKQILPRMEELTVKVLLPKFTFEFKTSLVQALQAMGIRDIFSGKADFSKMAVSPNGDLYVSSVLQKAGLQVNEVGTVAYAATEIELVSKFGEETIQFEARHPFLFFIEEEPTRTIVFVGKVSDPTAGGAASHLHQPQQQPPQAVTDVNNAATESSDREQSSTDTNFNRFGNEEEDRGLAKFDYFDIKLIQKMREKTKENFVVSPASIKTIMGMILEGANGRSADEISTVMRLPADRARARQNLHAFQKKLQKVDGGVVLKSGSRVLVNKNLEVSGEYRRGVSEGFSAQVSSTDFSSPQATAAEVNQWVSRVTQGFIPHLLSPDSVPPASKVVLLNAMFFKGTWLTQFDPDETKTVCFYSKPKECTRTPMMTLVERFKTGFLKELNAAVLEMPYTEERYSMVVLVPKERGGLEQLVTFLPLPFLSALDALDPQEVAVKIPKFTVDFDVQLSPLLEKIGVKEIFSESADLSGMLGGGSGGKVSQIVHRAKIQVNEQGTTAAGASAAVVVPLMSPRIVEFTADRPFLFFIRDKEAGILFGGQIVKPLEAAPQGGDGGGGSRGESPKRGHVHSQAYPPVSQRRGGAPSSAYLEKEPITFPRQQ